MSCAEPKKNKKLKNIIELNNFSIREGEIIGGKE